MRFYKTIKWWILFLPALWLQYAAIEMMFNILKRRLAKQIKDRIVNFCKDEGMREVGEWLNSFSLLEITRISLKAKDKIHYILS